MVPAVYSVLDSRAQGRLSIGNRDGRSLLACEIWKGKDKGMGLGDGLELVVKVGIEKQEVI